MINHVKTLLVFVSCLLFSEVLFCQESKPGSAEVEIPNKEDAFHVLNLGKNGVAVFSIDAKKTDNELGCHIHKFDADLKLESTKDIYVDFTYEVADIYHDDEAIYVLFSQLAYYARHQDLMIYRFDFNTTAGRLLTIPDIQVKKKHKVNDLELIVHNGRGYITGFMFKGMGFKGQTFLQEFSLNTNSASSIIVDNKLLGTLRNTPLGLNFNDEADELTLSAVSVYDEHADVSFIRYNRDGNLLGHISLVESMDGFKASSWKNAYQTHIADSTYIYLSTYKTKRSKGKKILDFSGFTEPGNAEGLFFIKATGSEVQFKKVINFMDLESLMALTKEKWNAVRLAKNEDEELVYSANLYCHPIVHHEGRYYLSGEMYYPVYSYYTQSDGDVRKVLDGYEHTYGVFICFDEKGNVLWDRTINMSVFDKGRFEPKLNVQMNEKSGRFECSYLFHSTIVSMSYTKEGNKLDEEYKYIKIPLEANDKLKNKNGNISYWYDQNFLFYGYAFIKNTETKDKRRVIYLSRCVL